LKPSLSVAENLALWSRYLGTGPIAIAAALEAVGLAAIGDLPAGYLSAGQRRRLSIARLAAVRRPIWLLDEPTSALDTAAQARLADLMRTHLAGGGLIFAATHAPLGLDRAQELRLGGA
jgi:heme exporter protein A